MSDSTNPVFVRQVLGTILSLTSGGPQSNALGLRIGDKKNPTTVTEVNKYLDKAELIEAELGAIEKEYPGVSLSVAALKELMSMSGS